MDKLPDLRSQRDYYDRLWRSVPAGRLNTHESSRRTAIELALRSLAREAGSPWSIADVGCGRGWLSGLVLSRFGRVLAVDLSPASIAKAQATFPGVRWQVSNILEEPLVEKYDLVVSSEVIEHVDDQRLFIDRLISATRSGGWILITTPNGHVARDYQLRAKAPLQPLENLLDLESLKMLLEERCQIVHVETAYFGALRGWRRLLVGSKPLTYLRRLLRERDPISRLLSRTGWGLYLVVLVQRLEEQ